MVKVDGNMIFKYETVLPIRRIIDKRYLVVKVKCRIYYQNLTFIVISKV